MSAKLSVQVSSISKPVMPEMEFLYNEDWTADAELQLIQKVHEILSVVRKNGVTLHLVLELGVKDPDQAMFMISKKIRQISKLSIPEHKLTQREIEILGLIMLGYTNKQIADKIFISFETVKSHRKHILEKTGAKNTAALIHFYHQTLIEK